MSAIGGVVFGDGRSCDRAVIERMQGVLTPYGRDRQRVWRQGGAAFVRTVRAVTPEDRLDAQPLHHAPTDTVCLFDGRLDNRDELGEALGLTPRDLAVMSDSDVVSQACLRWDVQALDRLLGDFVLACWRSRERRLWLARDPMGKRPLFWHRHGEVVAFASLPAALFAVPGVPRDIDEAFLHDHICLMPLAGPETFYRDVYRVMPGAVVTFEGGRVSARAWHTFDANYEQRLPSDDDYVEAFREHLHRAVQRRLRSVSGVASHLSSGCDSGTVTAVAAQELARANRRLRAYTAVPAEGFDGRVPKGRHADEGPGAAAVASRFPNIDHMKVSTSDQSPTTLVDEVVGLLDAPFLNTCNLPWIDGIARRAAADGNAVLLTGQMGNMSVSFDGSTALAEYLSRGQLQRWWREATALHRQAGRRWRGIVSQSVGPLVPPRAWTAFERLWHRRSWAVTDYTALHPDFSRRMDTAGRAAARGFDMAYRPWADHRRMRLFVLRRSDSGPNALLSEARGISTADPTADRRLFEFCLSLPVDQFLRDGRSRWLLWRLMRGVLPDATLQPATKGLQAADWYVSATADLPRIRQELMDARRHPAVREYLDVESLLHLVEHWPTGGWHTDAVIHRYRLKLLRGLSLASFIRYVDDRNDSVETLA